MIKIHNPFPRLTKAEGDEKLQTWSSTYKKRPFNGNIYHYTNLAALSGIVSSRSMFCTDYRQLNDTTELSLGLEVLEAAIAARAEAAGISANDVNDALDHLALLRQAPFHISMFAASFSMDGNDLTQWRAYAPRDGISVGFHETKLRRLAQEQHFVCGAVRYLGAPLFNEWIDKQLSGMKGGLERAAVNEAALRERASSDPQDHVDMMVQFQRSGNLERWIAEVSGLLKNPDFRSEREWRCLFVDRENTPQPKKPILFRGAGSQVIRYVELNFSNVDLRELISEVIIGPGNAQQETFQLTSDLLRGVGIATAIHSPFHAIR